MDEVGKPRSQGDWNRREIAVNKIEVKCHHFKHRHVKKELPAEQPYGESSHACSEESACLGVSLKCLYTNACSMGSKQEELEICVQLQGYDLIGIMGI